MKFKISFISIILALAWAARIVAAATVNPKPGDDLQAAINSAGANGTVNLSQGVYPISRVLTLPVGIHIIGTTVITPVPFLDTTTVPGVSIPSWTYTVSRESIISGPNIRAIQGSDGMTIANVSFDGSALWHSGTALNWTISGCNFNAKTKERAHQTIIEVNTFIGLNMHDCLVHEVPGAGIDALIYCYPAQGWISNCDFFGGNDCIHVSGAGNVPCQITFKQNHYAKNRANAVEYQNVAGSPLLSTSWAVAQDDWSDDPDYANFLMLLGHSMPGDRTQSVSATGCVTLANGQGNPNSRQRVAFEFACVNFTAKGNYVSGVRKPVTVTNSQTAGTVKGNCFENYIEATATGGTDTNGGKVAFDANNDQTVKIALLTRGRPGPFHSFNAPPTSQPTSRASSQPTSAPTSQATEGQVIGATVHTNSGDVELVPK